MHLTAEDLFRLKLGFDRARKIAWYQDSTTEIRDSAKQNKNLFSNSPLDESLD